VYMISYALAPYTQKKLRLEMPRTPLKPPALIYSLSRSLALSLSRALSFVKIRASDLVTDPEIYFTFSK
jgi:hypothetical protein